MVNQTPAQLRARTRQSLAQFNQQQRLIKRLTEQAQQKAQARTQVPSQPGQEVSQVSREALTTARAFEFIEKKARGERINLAQQPNDVQKEFERLSNQPNIRRVLDTTSEIKSLAIESGFGQDVQEFIQVSTAFQKRFTRLDKEELKKQGVEIRGTEVIINGVGASVPIENQAEFIRKQLEIKKVKELPKIFFPTPSPFVLPIPPKVDKKPTPKEVAKLLFTPGVPKIPKEGLKEFKDIASFIFKQPGKVNFQPIPGISGITKQKDITIGDVKNLVNVKAQSGGTAVKVGNLAFQLFVPETIGGLALASFLVNAGLKFPRATQLVGLGFTPFEVKQALDPELLPEQRILSGVLATLGFAGGLELTKPFFNKLNPKYVPIDETGIKFVPANTIPISADDIKNLQNLHKTTIHVTNNPFFKFDKNGQLLLKAFPGEAGNTRRNLQLFNFYKSLSKKQPNAYLGYVGIMDDSLKQGNSKIDFSLRKRKIKALIFNDEKISTTPDWVLKKGFAFTREWQNQQSGKTFVPVENLFGLSTEGQVISPTFKGSVLKDGKWLIISGDDLVKALNEGKVVRNLNRGTIIQKIRNKGFTYFKQTPESPALLKKIPLLDKLYQNLGARFNRIDLIEVKNIQLDDVNQVNKELNALNKLKNKRDLLKSEGKTIGGINQEISRKKFKIKNLLDDLKNFAKGKTNEVNLKQLSKYANSRNIPISKLLTDVSGGALLSSSLSKISSRGKLSGLSSGEKIPSSLGIFSSFGSVKPASPGKPFSSLVKSPLSGKTSKSKPLASLSKPSPIISRLKSRAKSISSGKSRPRPFSSLPPIPFMFGRRKPSRVRKRVSKIPEGWNVFGKPLKKSKKQKVKEFKKLNKVPLSQSNARDLGGWLIDHSLSRTFFIRKSGKKSKNPVLKIPKNYFQKNRRKFRDFRTIKGQKKQLKNKWIEKGGRSKATNFLLDTRAERRKITLLKQLASLRKKAFKPDKSQMSKKLRKKKR